MPKPTFKPHPIRQQVLAALVANERHTPLAGNVSWHNVDRLAKRWGR